MRKVEKLNLNRKLRAFLSCSLFLIFFAFNAFAEWRTVGEISQIVEQKANYVILQTSSGAKLRVEFFDINTIRIRLAPNGEFETLPQYAIDSSNERHTPIVKFTPRQEKVHVKRGNLLVWRLDKVLDLTNSFGVKVTIDFKPLRLTIFDETGEKVLASESLMFEDRTSEVKAINSRRSLSETYYGFGEKALPFSRDGQTITNWNTDAYRYTSGTDPLYQAIPFFIALDQGKSYGLFFNNSFRTTFDMGKTSPEKFSFASQGGELDYFFFTGGKARAPKQVLADYANLTGKMPLPPIWALGNQQSRFSYFPEARVREIANEFRARKIPADAIYIDIDYMDGFRIFTWDKEKFPDPKKLNEDLAKIGFKTILILNPAVKVDENFEIYKEAKRQDFFVKNADGTEFNGAVWAGKSAFLDFANPKVRDWFGTLYRKNLDEGVSGFWNDMNEPSNFPDWQLQEPIGANHSHKTLPLDAKHTVEKGIVRGTDMSKVYVQKSTGKIYNPLSFKETTVNHARFHNLYGMQMARATFEGLSKLEPNKRPFVLSRAGFSGVQRYAAVWTGDNTATWEHLRLSLPMLLNMSVSGIPFVGADVGGYSDNPSPELFARWMQAAALLPLFRPHAEKGTIDKEPWKFGAEVEKISRQAVELRYQFLPYLYTLFHEHERTGQPVLRPVWLEYSKDFRTYLIDDEYLVGRDLLVAPIVKEGQTKRNVYFPIGDDWRDWWTGNIYKGGTSAEIDAPLNKLPLFARVGSIIPTQPVVQHTGEMPNVPITLNVITGIAAEKTETSKLWQDAGDGYGYKLNDWREIRVEHKRGLLRLNRFGDFQGQQIRYIEALGVAKRPSEMRIDGKIVENIEVDATKQRLKIEIGDEAKEISLKP